ncbi:hypothetical protein ACFLY0_00945 [Patescibacteria group bacterium]
MESITFFFLQALVYVLFFAYDTAPYWIPPILLIIFVRTWVYYVRANFNSKRQRVLLEIKLPRDIYKSPLAMETMLGTLHQTGEGTWYDKYILGKTRTWFSLEIVSIEGKVRFFIWTEPFYRTTIEAQIYAQYPTIEIYEASDYTQHVPFGQKDSGWNMFGSEFTLTKKDPYPIKTYIDYGLDKDPKEEFKIDPITSVMEFLSSIGKDEQIWMQIGVRATTKTNRIPGGIFGKTYDWKKEAQKEVEDLKEKIIKSSGAEKYALARATKAQENEITAIERNISKPGFDCGIRVMYLAKDKFDPMNIPGLIGALKQFSSNDLNGFRPKNVTGFDYWWQDYNNFRMSKVKADLFNAYIRRSWFSPPHARKPFILNTEELATIFHFPGRVAETPAFERVESKKSEAPVNLPS